MVRFLETHSIQVGASYMVQFDMVMGCGEAYEEPQREGERSGFKMKGMKEQGRGQCCLYCKIDYI